MRVGPELDPLLAGLAVVAGVLLLAFLRWWLGLVLLVAALVGAIAAYLAGAGDA